MGAPYVSPAIAKPKRGAARAAGPKKRKAPKLRALHDKLWALISKYVRRSAADENGYVTCVTCGDTRPWVEQQAGHFVPQARGNAVKFDLRNIACQCRRCNLFLGGNPSAYAVYMLDRYGEQVIRELERRAHDTVKYSRGDYEAMIQDFSGKLANLDQGYREPEAWRAIL